MNDLLSIMETQLTDERMSLSATSGDIERAANYCQDNYLKGSTEGKLGSTMAYATQSLGTLSFHINRLAAHFLEALEKENNVLAEIKDRVEKVKMSVDIHEEKVARKAIGSCTTQKVPIVVHHETVISEPPMKYVRQPIDYTILDEIGHGSRMQNPSVKQYGMPMNQPEGTVVCKGNVSNTSSYSQQHNTMSCRSVMSKASLEYAAPSSLHHGSGTVGRTAGIYRTAVVPNHFLGPMVASPQPESISGGASPASSSIPSNYASSSSAVTGSVSVPPGTDTVQTLHSGRSSGSSSLAGVSTTQQMLRHQQGSFRTPVHYAINDHYAHQQQASMGQFVMPQQQQQLPAQQQQVMMMVGSSGAPMPVKMPITAVDMKVNTAAVGHANMLQQQQQMQFQLQRQPSLQQQQQQYISSHLMNNVHQIFAQQQQQQQQQQQHYQRRQPSVTSAGFQQNYAAQIQAAAAPDNNARRQLPQQRLPGQQPSNVNGNSAHSSEGQHASSGSTGQLVPRQPGDPAWAPEYYMEKVITLYEYTRDKDDELTFTENQIIYVIKKNDDGWWEGVMNGITGLFPGNFVELYDA